MANYPCEILHSDLITLSQTTQNKNKYILTILDDFTRYLHIHTISKKSDVSNCLNRTLLALKAMFPTRPYFRFLRCDNGTEFVCKNTENVLEKFGIELQTSEPFAHEHNGVIERLNRTLEERIRSLLFMSGFPNSFWGMAAHCATYLYNRTPHAALELVTPFEKVYEKQPDLSYIKLFGSRSYVYDDNMKRGDKTAPRSTLQYLVGFRPTGYITYCPKTKKANNVCSVKIDESIQYKHDFPSHDLTSSFEFPTRTQKN